MQDEANPDARHGPVGSPAFAQWLAAGLDAYVRNWRDSKVLAELRRARTLLAGFLIGAREDELKRVLSNQFLKQHLTLAGNGLRDLPLDADEQLIRDRVLSALSGATGQANSPGHVLAAMLYCRPDDPVAAFLHRRVPDWLYGAFTVFLVMDPWFFNDAIAYRRYREHSKQTIHHLHRIVADDSGTVPRPGSVAHATALAFTSFSCPLHPYFGDEDLKDMSMSRAYIFEQNARAAGLDLDWRPPARPAGRTRIRVGILKPHFTIQTETFATLPVFEHLDRTQFEVILYAMNAARNELEAYCASRADRLTLLPPAPREQTTVIRGDQIDILFFGSNLTARADACTTLALHRLAPIQMTSICSPITTGFKNMDFYLAGNLLAPHSEFQQQFREELVNVPGSGICFSYGPERPHGAQSLDRTHLGLPANGIVFISGSNYYKITPEVRDAWATIISRVPGSVLVLYPFNPYWSGWYDQEAFIGDMRNRFARLGLAEERLRILAPVPDRAVIKERLRIADVYLDAFPYGGATSLIDVLEAGVPPIVFKGTTLRSRQAASILEELELPQFIARTEDSYIELASRLGTDAAFRHELRDKVLAAMQNHPSCLDSRAYARNIALVFRTLHERNLRFRGDSYV